MPRDVKGTITVKKDAPDPKNPKKTKKVDVVFGYNELKSTNATGGGTRGIKIFLKGSPKGAQEYKFDPNPHADGAYNQGDQEKLYKEAAEDLVAHYYKDGEKFPRYGTRTVTALGKTYKLIAW